MVRVLGNEWPDPNLGASPWSDSVLQTLYDAIHAVALTTTGATSLMHEAKVDIVTVPNLSEHLSSAATTAQLSARFAYAAAMKSLNNLLLLGDGESWSRQTIDFAGLPEMVRTFLQVAAGAADIPVTRLLGQSPAGLSATGESDTRNYYDMIAARQEIDLRPQLERLDRLILRSAGVDLSALTFEFRPLWQMDAAASAAIALQKAQATQIYAGLGLWPASVTAALARSQLVEDGTYPGADIIFAEAPTASPNLPRQALVADFNFNPAQLRDPGGQWSKEGGASGTADTIANGEPTPPENAPIGEAPDGTSVESAGFRKGGGKRLSRTIGAILGAVARLFRWWRPEEPDTSSSSPNSAEQTPFQEPNPLETNVKSKLFTPSESASLVKLFKGGGKDGNEIGAQRLLEQLDKGKVDLPPEITRDVLERYVQVARDAINKGIDKRGVQTLRLRAINRILGDF